MGLEEDAPGGKPGRRNIPPGQVLGETRPARRMGIVGARRGRQATDYYPVIIAVLEAAKLSNDSEAGGFCDEHQFDGRGVPVGMVEKR
jgi:hypothetical protein